LWHLPGETEENHKKPKDIWCVSNQEPPIYELKGSTATSTCSVCIQVVGMPGNGPCFMGRPILKKVMEMNMLQQTETLLYARILEKFGYLCVYQKAL
jgi:hypothetical protein